MEENINNNKALVPIRKGNNQLVKTNNAIQITNKLISKSIEVLFNRAFYLLNSANLVLEDGRTLFWNHELAYYGEKNIPMEIDTDFLFHLESEKEYLEKMKFKYGINLDDCKSALEIFNEVIRINPTHKYSYLFRGIANQILKRSNDGSKDFDNANEDFLKAIKIDPNFVHALRHLGGIENINKIIKIDPFCDYIYLNRGRTKYHLKDHQGAIEDFTKAIEICSNNSHAFFERGEIKLGIKDYLGAIEDFSNAIEIYPMCPGFWYYRSIAKKRIGDIEGENADVKKVNWIDPTYIYCYNLSF